MLALAPVVLLAFHLPNPVSSLPLRAERAAPSLLRLRRRTISESHRHSYSHRRHLSQLATRSHSGICRPATKKGCATAVGLVGFDSFYRGVMQQPLLAHHATFYGPPFAAAAAAAAAAHAARPRARQPVHLGPCIYYPLYFAITGAIHGLTPRESLARAKRSGRRSWRQSILAAGAARAAAHRPSTLLGALYLLRGPRVERDTQRCRAGGTPSASAARRESAVSPITRARGAASRRMGAASSCRRRAPVLRSPQREPRSGVRDPAVFFFRPDEPRV